VIDVVFYFQVHQPYRLRKWRPQDRIRKLDYFDQPLNRLVAERVAERCYLPMNRVLREAIERTDGEFRCAFSLSGTVIRQLRDQNAVGVVVAVNGEVVWADLFASTQLLQKYWPKLVRSYATEAVVTRAKSAEASTRQAQKFLDDLQGRHETSDTEPGVYRQSEITGNGFKVFELTSLLPKTGFSVHVAKMAE